ncbi:MAG: CheR family methyltransferase [Solirubrobacteraceae bacterium]
MTTTVVDDYVEFCTLVRGLTGVDLLQYKRPQMERRLRSFYANRGVDKLTDALPILRADPMQVEQLLDRITINVSQLWRNPEQWQLLQSDVLPQLAERGQLRAWSAGCSYGAEAYTLAAICQITIPNVHTRIQGTDIDKRMVQRARLGQFSDDDARSAPADQLRHGFERIDGGWQAKPQLRSMTSFDSGDLLRIKPTANAYDLVLCRNTVIYFAEPIRDELHARLATSLRSGGYLVIGSTERVADPAGLGLTMQHPFIYRKS